ncbi:MAG TPA: hypothetical protein VND93_28095 [Myxococcales bacterium]|jgi:hypothetical protein|nr:hypothetical protein [Myxococcales bacterium]
MRMHHRFIWSLTAALALAPFAARADEDLPYDHHTRMTMKGTIREVKRIPKGRTAGVMLVVETDLEKIEVHLGPATFVDAQPMKLQVNDAIEITGSWVTLGVPGREAPYLVAEKITRGGQVMRLREESGRPLWRVPPRPPSA